MLNCCIQKRVKREHIDILSDESDERTPSCPGSAPHARRMLFDPLFLPLMRSILSKLDNSKY